MKTSFRIKPCFFFLIVALNASISLNGQISVISADVLMGKNNPDLVGTNYLLHKKAFAALEMMKNAAAKEGIEIKVVSAYRSYDRQRAIWNRKYKKNKADGLSPKENRQKIIMYSTLPGTSRHHWGTDVDLIDGSAAVKGDVLLARHFHNGGAFEPLRIWLEANAADYGFYCAYPNIPERTGFNYEPWHYSYRPIAIDYFNTYKQLELYEMLQDSLLEGYQDLNRKFIDRYRTTHVNGISKKLK